MRKAIIAGNWKMFKTFEESVQMASELKPLVSDVQDVEIVLCPTFPSLKPTADALAGSNVGLGAQNMSEQDQGAYTGEVSSDMLTAIGVAYVILGHSERREYFAESDELINSKVKKALDAGLKPILCVGEKLEQREAGITEAVVKEQLIGGLKDLSKEQMNSLVIAYEPVWAIGTGKTASPEQAQEVHASIRSLLAELFDAQTAESVRIQYGGSVKPENVDELMSQKDIDGALVGGASLKADSFARLVKFQVPA